jgi:hypothetical protein
MDKRDRVTTSSKEQMRSFGRVQVQGEITSKGGKDGGATTNHPRGLRHKVRTSCEHYVITSNRSRIISNWPLTPVQCTHICNGCYLAPVIDKHDRPTSGLASATPVTNVDFW